MSFDGHYIDWRKTRIDKILSIFGDEFFKGKTILELGAGYGDNGKIFENLGSIVTYAEGYIDNYNVIPGKKILLDQDIKWNLGETFDIIIHWGVLYHLDNWEQDLECALQHSSCIFLESEVSDSDDENFEIKVNESGNDQAVNKIGSRPSANKIEKLLKNNGAKFTRYDDEDINSSFHCYNWEVKNTKTWKSGLRRFWVIEK